MKYTAKQLDAHMRELASPRQLIYLDAVRDYGSQKKAAKALKCSQGTISKQLARLRIQVSDKRVEPHRDPDDVPEGLRIKGTSGTQYVYDQESGKYRMIWVKTERDPNLRPATVFEAMRGLLEEFAERGPFPDIQPPVSRQYRDDLIAVIPIGDFHFGQFSWGAECGQDHDLKTAKQNWRLGFDLLVGDLPYVSKVVGLNLGDLTHGDNSKNATPRSGFQLDIDTRHPKIVQTALECSLYAAYRAREKGRRVTWRNNIGNHDGETSHMITMMMDAHFNGIEVEGVAQEPTPDSRVDIMRSPKDLEVVETFGNVMITSSHGEYTKPNDIAGLLMDDFPEVVGAHPLRYHHSGHVHHRQRWGDVPGLTSFESHRTLTPKDKHATTKYRAPQSMEAIIYSSTFGEVGRYVVPIERIKAEVIARQAVA